MKNLERSNNEVMNFHEYEILIYRNSINPYCFDKFAGIRTSMIVTPNLRKHVGSLERFQTKLYLNEASNDAEVEKSGLYVD